jgi:hypothetical protein
MGRQPDRAHIVHDIREKPRPAGIQCDLIRRTIRSRSAIAPNHTLAESWSLASLGWLS